MIRHGTSQFWRANLALFLAAFICFALLHSMQPLLPIFTSVFSITPATSSLSLSASTGTLAIALLVVSWIADRFERKAFIAFGLCTATALSLLVAISPNWHTLLIARALMGVVLACVPATAMVYLAEEFDPRTLGVSMGLYVSGNAIGGMAGRIGVSAIAETWDWRVAVGALGVMAAISSVLFIVLLPKPQNSKPQVHRLGQFAGRMRDVFRDTGTRILLLESFLTMGAFVAIYNYAAFRLSEDHGLNHAAISLIYSIYLVGSFASATMGALAARLTRRKVYPPLLALFFVGILIGLVPTVWGLVVSLVVVTFAFFGAHAIAGNWVAHRAGPLRSQAMALYLFFYYLGASVIGTAAGSAWSAGRWTGVVIITGLVLAISLVGALILRKIKPMPTGRS